MTATGHASVGHDDVRANAAPVLATPGSSPDSAGDLNTDPRPTSIRWHGPPRRPVGPGPQQPRPCRAASSRRTAAGCQRPRGKRAGTGSRRVSLLRQPRRDHRDDQRPPSPLALAAAATSGRPGSRSRQRWRHHSRSDRRQGGNRSASTRGREESASRTCRILRNADAPPAGLARNPSGSPAATGYPVLPALPGLARWHSGPVLTRSLMRKVRTSRPASSGSSILVLATPERCSASSPCMGATLGSRGELPRPDAGLRDLLLKCHPGPADPRPVRRPTETCRARPTCPLCRRDHRDSILTATGPVGSSVRAAAGRVTSRPPRSSFHSSSMSCPRRETRRTPEPRPPAPVARACSLRGPAPGLASNSALMMSPRLV
jgi:hypothetical protein